MRERRKFVRVSKPFAVNIVALDTDGQHLRFDRIHSNPKYLDETGVDFSPGGIKIMCSKSLPKESRIQVKMLMPDEDHLNNIRASGDIKWFKQVKGHYREYFLMGVQFEPLKEGDREKITRLWKKYQ